MEETERMSRIQLFVDCRNSHGHSRRQRERCFDLEGRHLRNRKEQNVQRRTLHTDLLAKYPMCNLRQTIGKDAILLIGLWFAETNLFPGLYDTSNQRCCRNRTRMAE